MLTFNLLPPARQAELNFQKKLKKTIVYGKIFVGLLFILSLFMMFILVFLKNQKALLETQIKTQEEGSRMLSIQAIQKEVKVFNEELKALSASLGAKKWSSLLLTIASLAPPQITLEKISLENMQERRGLVLAGYAPRREHLITFEQNLKASPSFKNVILPLSNFRKTEDISFLVTLEIR